MDVLSKNKKNMNKPLGATFREDVAREHKERLAAIAPLLTALAMTDRLIDQIVYKLYGLTEEEIRIVEGQPVHKPSFERHAEQQQGHLLRIARADFD